MSKKAWICCGGCLVIGLVIGYFVAVARDGSTIANLLATLQLTETGEASDRAFQAYQHESSLVAIYALSEALDRLKAAEDFGATPIYTRRMMTLDELMLRARLARLCLAAGQTNSCEQQVAEALKCAQDVPACRAITNQAALMELIAKADKRPCRLTSHLSLGEGGSSSSSFPAL
jgi:hypothetical protein